MEVPSLSSRSKWVLGGVAGVGALFLLRWYALHHPPQGRSEAVAKLDVGKWRRESWAEGLLAMYYECFPMQSSAMVSRCMALPLKDGSLWLLSPGPVTDDMREVLQHSTRVHLCNGSAAHTSNLVEFITECTRMGKEVTLYTRPPLLKKMPELQQMVEVIFLQDEGVYPFSNELEHLNVEGNDFIAETVFFHAASHTLISLDLCQNQERVYNQSRYLNAVFGLGGCFGEKEGHQVTTCPPFRMMTTHKDKLRQSIRRMLQWDFHNVLVAHVQPVVGDGKEQVVAGLCKALGVEV